MNKLVLLALLISFNSFAQNQDLTLDDIWSKPDLSARQVPGFRSMLDGVHYSNSVTASGKSYIIRYEFSSGKAVDTILNGSELIYDKKPLNFTSYDFSDDESLILLTTESEAIYRHSSKADYYIYNRGTAKLFRLSSAGKQMYATISPDNKKVGFVRDNNLYVTDIATGKEVAVTSDGMKNSIINGAVDWVYEEEFTMSKGFFWNSASTAIAYYKFDESAVKEFNLTIYGELYPSEERYKYPKAGEENSKVSVYIYDVSSNKSVAAQTGNWEYYPRIKWTNDPGQVSIQCLNRLQNKLELLICNSQTGICRSVLREESKSYIDIADDLTFLKNGKEFIWSSNKSGFRHIYLYSMEGKEIKQITKGDYEVTQFYGYDEKTKNYFYQSAEPTAMDRRINKINVNGKKVILSPLTGFSKAAFNSSFDYFVSTYSYAGMPYRCAVKNADGKEIRLLEDNTACRNSLQKFALSPVEFISAPARDGVPLNGWILKPKNFDASKKYPVIFFVYGGIGKQTVLNTWQGPEYLWQEMMAQKGYIVVSFDNRGTPGRGETFATANYKNMGHIELEDQLDMAAYMKTLPYVDDDRLAIWGWSFGGYVTALAMTKGSGVFKCGVAVAPVTNWRYYDNIYTERFLQLPSENAAGYDDNSPINFAKDLKGKLLIMHGSADDNVHMQNTMEFVTALIAAKKQFDMFIYPNKNHSITGPGYRRHVYEKLTDYLTNNL